MMAFLRMSMARRPRPALAHPVKKSEEASDPEHGRQGRQTACAKGSSNCLPALHSYPLQWCWAQHNIAQHSTAQAQQGASPPA